MSLFSDEPCAFGQCPTCDILQQPDETLLEWHTRLRAMIAADPRASETATCKNGHPWTEATVYIHPDGRQFCRICMRASNKRSRLRRGAA